LRFTLFGGEKNNTLPLEGVTSSDELTFCGVTGLMLAVQNVLCSDIVSLTSTESDLLKFNKFSRFVKSSSVQVNTEGTAFCFKSRR